MVGNLKHRVAGPLCIYAVTAIWCWLIPSRLAIDDVESVINVFPTKALALATAALAIAHWAFALRGRMVVSVAGLWAVATTWMVTTFLVYRWQAPFVDSVARAVHTVTLTGAACALCVLGSLIVRRRLAIDANWFARGPLVLGIAGLAFSYAALALRSAGVLKQPAGLSAMADVIAGLTVDLWINSAILVLAAVVHVASSRLRSPPGSEQMPRGVCSSPTVGEDHSAW
jgi:hypothetical protein